MTTRFLRKKVRQQIRDNDSLQRVYPGLLRTPFFATSSIESVIFDDTTTISYVSQNTTFPAMLPVGYNAELTSSIKSVVNFAPSATENRLKLYNESIVPFNESLLNIPGTSDYMVTSSIVPGFNTPVRNKLAIPIDLTSTQEKFLFRLGLTDTTDPNGYFYGQASSGFAYYNFDRKCWEDIGLNEATPYVGHMGDVSGGPTGFNGQNYFMSQFAGTSNYAIPIELAIAGLDLTTLFGSQHIGTPYEFFDAPNAPRYHATASQGLSLKNYINQPFVVEQIDVTLPFVARRKLGPPRSMTGLAEGVLRDIDNLVFFMYRQDGDIEDKTKSIRKLIAHESLTFHTNLVPNLNFTLHNPVFSHEYQFSDFYDTTEKLFTGSVSFTMKPKISSEKFTGITAFFARNGSSADEASIAGYWSGPIASALTGTNNPISSSYNSLINDTYVRTLNSIYDVQNYKTKLSADPRLLVATVTGSVESLGFNGVYGSGYASQIYSTASSPYVLFPSDRLIFGLESSIQASNLGFTITGREASHLSHTGSFFKILTDEAKVTLYGSLIQDNRAKPHNSINQKLVSPAIHEIISSVQDDSDQYLIDEKLIYQGNYLSNYMSGSFFDGTRRIYDDLATTNQTILSASFGRFLQLNNLDKIYYDCLIPNPKTYVTSLGNDILYNYNSDLNAIVLNRLPGSGGVFEFEAVPRDLGYPFQNTTATRSRSINAILQSITVSTYSELYSDSIARQLLYYVGNKPFTGAFDPQTTTRKIILNHTGSSAIRYGMKNIINENPKSIFRPDRYGQFRDMLEQAHDSALYDLSNIKKNQDPPVIINFVTSSSDDPIDPSATSSNNFSKYATSSFPYFDGLNRSRPDYTVTKNPTFSPAKLVFKT